MAHRLVLALALWPVGCVFKQYNGPVFKENNSMDIKQNIRGR